MTTDQPMPGCARCRDGVTHTKHVIGETPTPTSSLEEAREAVINAALLPFTPAGEPLRAYVTERVDSLVAAARAEVIREVEALAEREHAIMWARTGRAWADAVEEDADLCRGRALRALSQGGENGGVR